MARGFLEVFPGLTITEELKELLTFAQVTRVTSSRDRSSLRVYLESPRLIHKQVIYDLEAGIREQLFPGKQISVKFRESIACQGSIRPRS